MQFFQCNSPSPIMSYCFKVKIKIFMCKAILLREGWSGAGPGFCIIHIRKVFRDMESLRFSIRTYLLLKANVNLPFAGVKSQVWTMIHGMTTLQNTRTS